MEQIVCVRLVCVRLAACVDDMLCEVCVCVGVCEWVDEWMLMCVSVEYCGGEERLPCDCWWVVGLGWVGGWVGWACMCGVCCKGGGGQVRRVGQGGEGERHHKHRHAHRVAAVLLLLLLLTSDDVTGGVTDVTRRHQ